MSRNTDADQTLFPDEQERALDDEQRIDAKQALGCGLTVRQVAKAFGLTEERLRVELGMPVWKSETPSEPWWKRGVSE